MCQSLYQTACTMTTSIEIAEKVVEEAEEEIEGLDALSAYIESVLARTGLKIVIFSSIFRWSSKEPPASSGVHLKTKSLNSNFSFQFIKNS